MRNRKEYGASAAEAQGSSGPRGGARSLSSSGSSVRAALGGARRFFSTAEFQLKQTLGKKKKKEEELKKSGHPKVKLFCVSKWLRYFVLSLHSRFFFLTFHWNYSTISSSNHSLYCSFPLDGFRGSQ